MAGVKGRSGSGGKRLGAGRKKGTLNKATADVKAIAGKYTEQAVKELARLALNAESETARVAAIKELLDRGHGKAQQAVTVDPGDTFSAMLRAFLASIDGDSRGLPKGRLPIDGAVSRSPPTRRCVFSAIPN